MRFRFSRQLASVSVLAAVAASMAVFTAPALAVTTVQQEYNGPSLFVRGDDSANHLVVSYDPILEIIEFREAGITKDAVNCGLFLDRVACVVPTGRGRPYPPTAYILEQGGDDSVTVDASVPADLSFVIEGGSGADSISGGPEFDYIDGDSGPDSISGGGGSDTINYSERRSPVRVVLDGTRVSGGAEDGGGDAIAGDLERLIGGQGADVLVGNDADNYIDGEHGADLLLGMGGADELIGFGTASRVHGGPGADSLSGSAKTRLLGGKGIDFLDAKDGFRERLIHCGPGNNKRERATRDHKDPRPISC